MVEDWGGGRERVGGGRIEGRGGRGKGGGVEDRGQRGAGERRKEGQRTEEPLTCHTLTGCD